MQARTNPTDLNLPKRAIYTLPDAAGIEIECLDGSVWITLDDDPRDTVLAPGQRFASNEHRRALVSALESSRIALTRTQPATPVAARQSHWRLRQRGLSPA